MQTREPFGALKCLIAGVGAVLVVLGAGPSGFAQAPFYQGKVITVIQGRDPGGAGDLRARATTNFLQKYLPGSTIVHQFMAGGGRLRVANHIFAGAAADCLTIGSMSSGMSGTRFWAAPASNTRSKNFIFSAPPTPPASIFSIPGKKPV
jgi:tripartite-type tricarboxylate transporter receptor subunit TctC